MKVLKLFSIILALSTGFFAFHAKADIGCETGEIRLLKCAEVLREGIAPAVLRIQELVVCKSSIIVLGKAEDKVNLKIQFSSAQRSLPSTEANQKISLVNALFPDKNTTSYILLSEDKKTSIKFLSLKFQDYDNYAVLRVERSELSGGVFEKELVCSFIEPSLQKLIKPNAIGFINYGK